MSDTKNTAPASPDSEGAARARRRWVPIALIGVAVLVVLAVVIAWATGAANQGRAATSGTGSPSISSSDASAQATEGASADDQGASAAAATGAGDTGERAMSDPHPFDSPVDIATGVTATVGSLTSVEGQPEGVGETGGPAIRFEVTLTNNTADDIDLSLTTVLVDYGPDAVPGGQMSGNSDTTAFPASLGAGESATAVYVFTVPADQRAAVRVVVDYLAGVPLAVFTGAAPAA